MTAATFVGIDVSKAHLDLAARPTGLAERLPNDEAGIGQIVARLRPLEPTLVVLEATGGLEVPLAAALAVAGLAVAVVNPRQVRDFARAVGQLARPTPSTPSCSRVSPRLSGPSRARYPMRTPKISPRSWRVANR